MKTIIEALEFVEMKNIMTGVALGLPMVAVPASTASVAARTAERLVAL